MERSIQKGTAYKVQKKGTEHGVSKSFLKIIYETMDILNIMVSLSLTTMSVMTVVSIPIAAVIFIMDVIMWSDSWSCVEIIVVSYWDAIWSVMSIVVASSVVL